MNLRTIGTVSIGGADGGYIQIGEEKDTELGITLSLKKIEAGKEFKQLLPHPGTLLNYIIQDKKPRVVLSDGNVIVPAHRSGEDEFTDIIARLWAYENDGIYFPSQFGDNEQCLISFNDFIRALERCRPNMLNDPLLHKLYKVAIQQNAFDDLSNESTYLTKVKVLESSTPQERRLLNGLEGIVQKKNNHEEFSPPLNKSCTIFLGLSLEGFGWHHLNVSARKLSTKLYADIYEESDAGKAIAGFIHQENYKEDIKNYSLKVTFSPYKYSKERKIEDVILSMESPRFNYPHLNNEMKYPVMSTQEMLPIFEGVLTKIARGLQKIKTYQEEQSKLHAQEIYTRMGF